MDGSFEFSAERCGWMTQKPFRSHLHQTADQKRCLLFFLWLYKIFLLCHFQIFNLFTCHCSFDRIHFLANFKEVRYKFKLFILQQSDDKLGILEVRSTRKEENKLQCFLNFIIVTEMQRRRRENHLIAASTESALHFKKVFLLMFQMYTNRRLNQFVQ